MASQMNSTTSESSSSHEREHDVVVPLIRPFSRTSRRVSRRRRRERPNIPSIPKEQKTEEELVIELQSRSIQIIQFLKEVLSYFWLQRKSSHMYKCSDFVFSSDSHIKEEKEGDREIPRDDQPRKRRKLLGQTGIHSSVYPFNEDQVKVLRENLVLLRLLLRILEKTFKVKDTDIVSPVPSSLFWRTENVKRVISLLDLYLCQKCVIPIFLNLLEDLEKMRKKFLVSDPILDFTKAWNP